MSLQIHHRFWRSNIASSSITLSAPISRLSLDVCVSSIEDEAAFPVGPCPDSDNSCPSNPWIRRSRIPRVGIPRRPPTSPPSLDGAYIAHPDMPPTIDSRALSDNGRHSSRSSGRWAKCCRDSRRVIGHSSDSMQKIDDHLEVRTVVTMAVGYSID